MFPRTVMAALGLTLWTGAAAPGEDAILGTIAGSFDGKPARWLLLRSGPDSHPSVQIDRWAYDDGTDLDVILLAVPEDSPALEGAPIEGTGALLLEFYLSRPERDAPFEAFGPAHLDFAALGVVTAWHAGPDASAMISVQELYIHEFEPDDPGLGLALLEIGRARLALEGRLVADLCLSDFTDLEPRPLPGGACRAIDVAVSIDTARSEPPDF